MAHERRRSTVHDIMNAVDSSEAHATSQATLRAREGHLLAMEDQSVVASAPFRPILPPIDTPDKCQEILGCKDSHTKEAHSLPRLNDQREHIALRSSSDLASKPKDAARYYPSPNSELGTGLYKNAGPESLVGPQQSAVEPSSCDSSRARSSFDVIHLCKTGPNALDGNSSVPQTSSSRQSSHQQEWPINSPNTQQAVNESGNSNDWNESADHFGSVSGSTPAEVSRKHSTTESDVALLLTEMSGGRTSDHMQGRSASSGRENYSPTEPRVIPQTSQVYEGVRLPPIRPAPEEQDTQNNLSYLDQRRSLQSTSEFGFGNPFRYPTAEEVNLAGEAPMLQPHSAQRSFLRGFPSWHNLDKMPAANSRIQENGFPAKKRRALENDVGESFYVEVPIANQASAESSPNPGAVQYGPILANGFQSYEPISGSSSPHHSPQESLSSSSEQPANGHEIVSADESTAAISSQVAQPDTINSPNDIPEESNSPSHPHRSDRSFSCCFMGDCDTPGDNPRKAFSDFFGRNKTCTTQVPKTAWNLFCRQHYQRVKYRFMKTGNYYETKVRCVDEQIEKFDHHMGSAAFPEHGEIVWTIGYQKGLRKAVSDGWSRRAKRRDTEVESDDVKVQKLNKEVSIAMDMEDYCGANKSSEDCRQFLRQMVLKCMDEDLRDLIRVEFLPVEWGGKQRTKPVTTH